MKVAIRVDSSRAIGTGHVYRCLTLAGRLCDQGADCHFVMRAHDGALFDLVVQAGFTAHRLPAPADLSSAPSGNTAHADWLGVPLDVDAAETMAVLGRIGRCDWLVVDHYALDARWEHQLRDMVDRLMVIDDLADRPHDCDLLLDQNLQERPDRYQGLLPDRCKALLGPRYALLRPEFAAARIADTRDYQRPVHNVLLFVGGVDLPGLTPVLLATIERCRAEHVIAHVVLGAANPRREAIERDWANRDWVRIHRAPTDLVSLMRQCDIAIGAGGTATWERCCLGLPSMIVSIAANQQAGARAMNDCGAALYAGDNETLDDSALSGTISVLLYNGWTREAVGAAAAALVDGQGADRVAQTMRPRRIHVRPAVATDARDMLIWRNDGWTRRFVRDPGEIRSEDHMAWFARTLAASDRDLLIGETDDGPIGVVRFDCDGDKAEVSIFLVPGRQGKGAGSDLLRAALEWFDRNRPETHIVDAEILEANLSSRRAFESVGFQPYSRHYRRIRPVDVLLTESKKKRSGHDAH